MLINFPKSDVPIAECRVAVQEKRMDVAALWIYGQYLDAVAGAMLAGDDALARQARRLAARIVRESGHLTEYKDKIEGSGVLQDLRDERLDRAAGLPAGWSTRKAEQRNVRGRPFVPGERRAAMGRGPVIRVRQHLRLI